MKKTGLGFVNARIKKYALSFGLSMGLALLSSATWAAAFTPGNLIVYRVGDGSTAVSANATAVFLDEYRPDGTLVQSLAMPTTTGTSPLTNPLTASSTGSEGLLNRSADGKCLTVPGYAAPKGTAGIAAVTTSSTVATQRSVAFVDSSGNVDTTTTLGSSAFSKKSPRGAVTDSCSHVWVSGAGNATTNQGIWYATKGAATATQLYATNAGQGISISGSQLYSSINGLTLDTVGTGLPTATGQTVTALSSNIATANYRGIAFLKLRAGATGNDTIYLANNTSTTIDKYSYNGSAWVAKGSTAATGNAHGLAAVDIGDGNVALYFTDSNSGNVYRIIDRSGPTGTMTTAAAPYATFVTASGAPTNAVFYGLALAPEATLTTQAPNAPTSASATSVTSTSFTANWTAPASGATVAYYVVEISGDNFTTVSQTVMVSGSQTFANITGLSSSSNYYRIRAVNSAGASADLSSGNNISQTISFGAAPSGVVVGGTASVSATATSGLAVSFSSTTSAVCTISGSTVNTVSAGTCTIAADQAGNAQYSAATEVTQSFTVGGSAQVINFGSAPTNVVVGGVGTVTATGGGSGNAVVFSSTTASVCSVSGNVVTGIAVGTCTIAADQAGNANYFAAAEKTQSFNIGAGSQSIVFGTAPSVTVGGTATVSATASSGLPVSFTSTTASVCSVAGTTVSGLSAGTCTIAADQAGNANYLAASEQTQSFSVGAGSQTVSFTSVPVLVVGGTSTAAAQGGASGNAVTFSSTTASVCSVSGSTITGVAVGTCTIAADQAGNANYSAAATATQSVNVANPISAFTAGGLVVSTVSNVNNGGADLDSAAPIVLHEFQLASNGTSATLLGTMTLPQTSSGSQWAISGEFGSASEGVLQQSVNGQYLTIMGYGVNAAAFSSGGAAVYGNSALGQSTSLTAANQTGTPVTTVPRVVALISANGSVDTSTALTGVYNQNNPRSATTVDGSAFYTSGQATSKTDPTQGVAYAALGATTATVIDNSTDTRVVTLINNGSSNTLYVSRDQNPSGSGGKFFTNIGTLTDASGALPTSASGLVSTHVVPVATPYSLGGNNSSINVTADVANGVNNARIGSFVYLSPEQYFLASPTVMYVADSGQPKNGSANAAALGEGGLQKWILVNGTWTLAYDLVNGLNLVNNANVTPLTPTLPGVTGLLSLTGRVVNGQVQLFATSYGLNELSQSYVYEITDDLSATSISQVGSEQFTVLFTDASGQTSIRGVAFAPNLAPQTIVFGTAPSLVVGGTASISATGGASGNAVSLTSTTTAVCSVSGNVVTGVSVGTCTIAADQAGNSQYSAAGEVTQSFSVGMGSQSISFGVAPTVAVNGSGILNATGGASGNAVSFTSVTPAVCTVAGSTVTGVSIGSCTVAADQAGNSQYSAASQVTQSFAINGLAQTISFGAAPANVVAGGSGTLSAAGGSSGNTVTFTSLTASVCTVSGNTVTGVSAGTCTVAADQAGDSQYNAATEVTQSFSIGSSAGAAAGNTGGDVPLPPWAYAILMAGLLASMWHYRRRA